MSIEHMAMVFAAGGIPANERLLLLAYTNRCDAHGYCWPGEKRLVAETGMSVSTLRRAKKSLVMMELIGCIKRGETSDLTRVNIQLLASMKRRDRTYDDNLVQKIGFAEDAATNVAAPATRSVTPSDLGSSQYDPTLRSDWHQGGVNLTSPSGQYDPQTLSEPVVEPSVIQKASVADARRASTGSRANSTRGKAASGKSRTRLGKDQYTAIKAVRELLPDALQEALPTKMPPNLSVAILEALAIGAPCERTPAQLVEYRVLKRWNGYWAAKFFAGELIKGGKPSVVGPLLSMLRYQQECGDLSCEDRVNVHTGEPCRSCETRREDRRQDRFREQQKPVEGEGVPEPRTEPAEPAEQPVARPRCPGCDLPLATATVAVLCRDCRKDGV